jgi:ferritin-like metal-binding protein YciE
MPKKPEGMEQLLQGELQDLLDAEKQIVRALPKLAKAVNDDELEQALREHLEVTKGQIERLNQVFETLDMRPRSRPCKGMKGIVEEGSEMLEEFEGRFLDSAVAGAARKVEHYEMVSYESARSLAQKLGRKDAAQLLDETLREEVEADKTLAKIAKKILQQRRPATAGANREERRPTARKSTAGRKGSASSGRTGHSAHPLTDHEEIRRWAEERRAVPSCVRGTGGGEDTGMIRLDFPGYSGGESLEEISWDDWFEKFDASNLALLVQESTAGGAQSNFNKLVKRTTAEQRPRARSAR